MSVPRLAASVVVSCSLFIGVADSAAGPAGAEPPRSDEAPLILHQGTGIPGQYIVVLRPRAERPHSPRDVAQGVGAVPVHEYDTAIIGFAGRLNDHQLNALRRNPNVQYIEQDGTVTADATQQLPPWHLDRIDQRARPLDNAYSYTATGSNVRAYVIDTGIQTSHADFGGRAKTFYDALGGNGQDCHGHGTHVAGIVGGSMTGVAKAVKLYSVRVLGCNGSGTTSGVIAGVNYVAKNVTYRPAIANMSLGGAASSTLDSAVSNLVAKGVFVSVAAGNSNALACNYSPARVASAFTVAASDEADSRASFSNYGSCVDAYGPGVNVLSTWLNNTRKYLSGTSMASPVASGIAALRLSSGNVSPSTVTSWLKNNATTAAIKNNPSGTANRLLYKSTL